MSSSVIALDGIAATCAMLAGAMFIGWRRYVRESYVAVLAIAFTAIAGGYTALLGVVAGSAYALPATALAAPCFVVGLTMLAGGFRLRSRLSPVNTPIGATAATALAICWFALLRHGSIGGVAAVLTVYGTFSTILCARALVAGRAIGLARGGPAFWMFVAYVVFLCVQLVLFAAFPWMTARYRAIAEFVWLTGPPAGMTGIGLFAILLIVEDLSAKLHRLALVDPLTGVLNRRGIEQAAAPLVARAARRGGGLAVIVADLDRFKAVNDGFGHALGDRVLQRFAGHARRMMRAGDLVGRLGGEEFVFVIDSADRVAAHVAIERVRVSLAAVFADLELPMPITASYGIATFQAGDALESLLIRADRALYGAKANGRDRIIFAEPDRPATDERFRIAWARDDVVLAPARRERAPADLRAGRS